MKQRRSPRSFFAAAVACVLPLAAAPSLAAQGDTILRKGAGPLRGVEVLETTATAVKYKQGNTAGEVPAADVLGLSFADAPESLQLAQAAEAKGEFDNAANLYMEAAKTANRAPLQQHARFLAAQVLLRGAGADPARASAAADALRAFVGELPTALQTGKAKLLLARALRLAGKPGEAITVCKGLEEEARQKNDLAQEARVKLERALAHAAEGKGQDARHTFQGVISAAETLLGSGAQDPEMQELRLQAMVGSGEAYVHEKQLDNALRHFTQMSSSGDPGVKAAGLAGEGQVLYLQATGGGGAPASGDAAKKLRDAQMRLAEATITDFGSGNTTAKALYYTGKVLLALGQSGEGDEWKTRAQEYFSSIVSDYADSRWAAVARAELSGK